MCSCAESAVNSLRYFKIAKKYKVQCPTSGIWYELASSQAGVGWVVGCCASLVCPPSFPPSSVHPPPPPSSPPL